MDEESPKNLPWWDEKIYGYGGYIRWSRDLHQLVKDANPDTRRQVLRNASLILCHLLNLARKIHVGVVREREIGGWMRCGVKYIENGTDISRDEQLAAFPVLSRWVQTSMRGAPAKRHVLVDFDKLVADLKEARDRRCGLGEPPK